MYKKCSALGLNPSADQGPQGAAYAALEASDVGGCAEQQRHSPSYWVQKDSSGPGPAPRGPKAPGPRPGPGPPAPARGCRTRPRGPPAQAPGPRPCAREHARGHPAHAPGPNTLTINSLAGGMGGRWRGGGGRGDGDGGDERTRLWSLLVGWMGAVAGRSGEVAGWYLIHSAGWPPSNGTSSNDDLICTSHKQTLKNTLRIGHKLPRVIIATHSIVTHSIGHKLLASLLSTPSETFRELARDSSASDGGAHAPSDYRSRLQHHSGGGFKGRRFGWCLQTRWRTAAAKSSSQSARTRNW